MSAMREVELRNPQLHHYVSALTTTNWLCFLGGNRPFTDPAVSSDKSQQDFKLPRLQTQSS